MKGRKPHSPLLAFLLQVAKIEIPVRELKDLKALTPLSSHLAVAKIEIPVRELKEVLQLAIPAFVVFVVAKIEIPVRELKGKNR